MMRRFALALVSTVAAGPASAGPAPFELFKTVCIDTRALPEAADKAAAAMGGVPRPKARADDRMMQHMMQFWDFGPHVWITTDMAHIKGLGDHPATDMSGCTLNADERDESSIARFKAWIGIAPKSAGGAVALYEFLDEDGKHLPTPKDEVGGMKALSTGHLWMANILTAEDSMSLDLVHDVIVP